MKTYFEMDRSILMMAKKRNGPIFFLTKFCEIKGPLFLLKKNLCEMEGPLALT